MLLDFTRLYIIACSQGNAEAAERIRDVLLWLLQ